MTDAGPDFETVANAQLMNAEDLRLLASIALMALARGHPGKARAMIDVLHLVRPGSEIAAVTESFFLLGQRDIEPALRALDTTEQTMSIRTTRAIVLMAAGRVLEAFDLLSEFAGAPAGSDAAPAAELYGVLAEALSRNPGAVLSSNGAAIRS